MIRSTRARFLRRRCGCAPMRYEDGRAEHRPHTDPSPPRTVRNTIFIDIVIEKTMNGSMLGCTGHILTLLWTLSTR